jgi:hypothetical protein
VHVAVAAVDVDRRELDFRLLGRLGKDSVETSKHRTTLRHGPKKPGKKKGPRKGGKKRRR